MKIFIMMMVALSFNIFAETSPKEAFSQAQKGSAVLIDVREKDEIAEGMIENAKWFPLSKIESDKEWTESFKKMTEGKKIFLYCRSGKRSGRVETILKEHAISSENIGGYMELKNQLPTKKP
jgi:rhodanese-related sulfurtransferase